MDIRQISLHLATRVIQQAVEEGLKVYSPPRLYPITVPKKPGFSLISGWQQDVFRGFRAWRRGRAVRVHLFKDVVP